MTDKVFTSYLQRQYVEGLALVASSDVVKLTPLRGTPPQQYLAQFHCKGLVQDANGHIGEADLFEVGIFFPSDYLRRADAREVLTWLKPVNVYHPNIYGPAGAICIGRLQPGLGLVDLLYQIFEIIVYRKFNSREYDSLNKAACAWARNNQNRFPTDPRPLKRSSYSSPAPGTGQGGAS